MANYVHGFDPEEQLRLQAQAGILAPMVYREIDFSGCQNLLEVGSGVGAQTRILLERFPQLRITCVDSSAVQLAQARINLASFGDRVRFVEQDGCSLSLSESFDAAFICWTLEHVSSPIQLLVKLKEHLQLHQEVPQQPRLLPRRPRAGDDDHALHAELRGAVREDLHLHIQVSARSVVFEKE